MENKLQIQDFGWTPGGVGYHILGTTLDARTFNTLATGTKYVALKKGKGFPGCSKEERAVLDSDCKAFVLDLDELNMDHGMGDDWIREQFGEEATDKNAYMLGWFQACRNWCLHNPECTYGQYTNGDIRPGLF